MKEPLRDAFFQPANHPYFVKEKSFWTIERVGVQKRADVIGIPSATASDSLYSSYRTSDGGGSRAGSVNLSLPPAASSSSQLAPARDGSAAVAAVAVPATLACPTEQCCANPRSAIRKTASVQPEKGSSSVGLGDGCCFPAPPGAPASGRGSGIVINAATCPNLCRHASFLTDSLNRRNLFGGYFDADYEDGTLGRDVPVGSSRRRRPRRRSDSLRRDSGSMDSSLGYEQPNVGSASDRPAGGGRRQCMTTAGATSAVAVEVTSVESGSLQPCAATVGELSAVTSATAAAVVSAETAATVTSASDCQDICSICSSSSDGSGNAADVIQPVALKLHLADEVRGDVTKLATSLTRRLFFARGPKHEDVPATPSAALYHRDSDRSHLDVRSPPTHAAEVQRSASVSRCSISVSHAVIQDGFPAVSKEQRRASGQAAQASVQLRSKHSERQPSSRGDACASVTSTGRRLQRSADRAAPWVTSASSRVSLELQASAETRFGGNFPRDVVSGSSSSSTSGGGLFATTVEQLSVDDSTGHGERHERKRRRCRRRCCRAVTICVVLAVIGAVVAAVTTLHFEGQLTSSPVARNTTVFDSSAAVSTTTTTTTISPSKSITINFVGALRLMMEFLPEMADINSTASRNLSRLFCSAVDRIYYNNSDSLVYDPLFGCQVTNLSFGSITVHFALTFLSFGGDHSRRDSSLEKATVARVKTIFTEAVNTSRLGSSNHRDIMPLLMSDITSLVLWQINDIHADNTSRSASATESQDIGTFEPSPSTTSSLRKDESTAVGTQSYASSTACDCPVKIGNAVLGSASVPLLSDSTLHIRTTYESTDSTAEFRLSTSSASLPVNMVELQRSTPLPNRGNFPLLTPLPPLAVLTGKMSVDSIRASPPFNTVPETVYRQPTLSTAEIVTLRPATTATPAAIVVSQRSVSATTAVSPALSTTTRDAGSRSGLLPSELEASPLLLLPAAVQPAAGSSNVASFVIADDRVPGSTTVTLLLQQPALPSPFPCEVPLEYANCLFYMQCNGTDRYCSAASVTSAYVGAVATDSCAGPVLCCPGQKFYYNAFTGLCEKCCHFSRQEAEAENRRGDCTTGHAIDNECIWECVPDTCLVSGLPAVGHDDASNSNNNYNNE